MLKDRAGLDNTFKNKFFDVIQGFIDEGRWFYGESTETIFLFHPLEIIKSFNIKCFIMREGTVYQTDTKKLTINDFLVADEIVDKKMLKELNAELAKSMLQKDI